MMNFGKISQIIPADKSTWDRIFLTFDLDWACDAVLADCIDLVERAGVEATWFVTHETPLLSRLLENPRFEVGVHPNFNYLLDGDFRNGRNAEEVIDRLLAIVPEARAVRSHSLLQSERLLELFTKKGLTHVSNFFVPMNEEMRLGPWNLWGGLTIVPHCWQDNVSCLMNGQIEPPEGLCGGIRVYDFHPIHVFLNTECMQRYETTRHLHQSPVQLAEHRFAGRGARFCLNSVLEGQ